MTEIKSTEKLHALRQSAQDGCMKVALDYLRLEISNNIKLKELLNSDERPNLEDVIEAIGELPNHSHMNDAVEVFIDEIRKMNESGTPWIIDHRTGLAIVPVNKDSLFTTLRIREDGTRVPGTPILHPAISAALVLGEQKRLQRQKAISTLPAAVVAHEVRPDSILDAAKDAARKIGISIHVDIDGEIQEMEIGKENSDGLNQSPNAAFHRYALYGELITKRIARAGGTMMQLISVKEKSNARTKWFIVQFKSDAVISSSLYPSPAVS